MKRILSGVGWVVGAPLRLGAVSIIRLYRVTLAGILGGNCRFHPSCSAYAEAVISGRGILRGAPLSAWRLARCSPLSRGGVDYPPERRPGNDDAIIQPRIVAAEWRAS